ncbi:regulatory associated protein-mTOR [Zalerion maritima]|uniref:Regulatory associated protein-mTOR n=1 Tax=Zalerion maritima TaxID=339359 RepID=A0AAD5RQR8_9PEZI|nr:regulatory associated protein-mTOR [Zalerion maritima]
MTATAAVHNVIQPPHHPKAAPGTRPQLPQRDHAVENGARIPASASHEKEATGEEKRKSTMTMNHHAPVVGPAATMTQTATHHPLHQQHQQQYYQTHAQHGQPQPQPQQQQQQPNGAGAGPGAGVGGRGTLGFTHPERSNVHPPVSNNQNGRPWAGTASTVNTNQHPHQQQPGNHVSNGTNQTQPPTTTNNRNLRVAAVARSTAAANQGPAPNDTPVQSSSSSSKRPSSAPGKNNSSSKRASFTASTATANTSGDETGSDPDTDIMTRRRPSIKPPLMRSKSEHSLRRDVVDSSEDEDVLDENGPRHGFEDHYQSEEFVSQLASNSIKTLGRRPHDCPHTTAHVDDNLRPRTATQPGAIQGPDLTAPKATKLGTGDIILRIKLKSLGALGTVVLLKGVIRKRQAAELHSGTRTFPDIHHTKQLGIARTWLPAGRHLRPGRTEWRPQATAHLSSTTPPHIFLAHITSWFPTSSPISLAFRQLHLKHYFLLLYPNPQLLTPVFVPTQSVNPKHRGLAHQTANLFRLAKPTPSSTTKSIPNLRNSTQQGKEASYSFSVPLPVLPPGPTELASEPPVIAVSNEAGPRETPSAPQEEELVDPMEQEEPAEPTPSSSTGSGQDPNEPKVHTPGSRRSSSSSVPSALRASLIPGNGLELVTCEELERQKELLVAAGVTQLWEIQPNKEEGTAPLYTSLNIPEPAPPVSEEEEYLARFRNSYSIYAPQMAVTKHSHLKSRPAPKPGPPPRREHPEYLEHGPVDLDEFLKNCDWKSSTPANPVQNWYMYYTDKRHETTGKPKPLDYEVADWRMRDRLKTVSAALAVCLNIGVEPPDQLKTNPGAKLEAWHDPTAPPLKNALETIGKALQQQYTVLAGRTRYKQYLDPSVEETKKFCISLRRNAKDERVLLHYNGHGVPKPTSSGEIWVFNKNYTQYIPVSLYDLQHWLQAPTIFVWDCSEAGNILTNYDRFVEKHEAEEEEAAARDPTYDKMNFRPYIHLAACQSKENLPTNPQLPADLFTCCLTTPVETALWFFVLQNPLKTDLTPERAKKLPGTPHERRSPLGELNWIFTAITDTIAWTTLPRPLFRQYFRQDLMVAALFRNFLLAQRIMSVYGCHPQSYPTLPDTRQHPLWESWDLAVDMALAQLPMIERKEADGIEFEYQPSSFFTEQLTAFDVYLTRGDAMAQKPPDQLPILLQVLLSQQHRVRALILLGRFLDLGPWAVQLALSIGIFPYVLKLLQSTAAELKPVMVFIWTRVLAVDISCQGDLIKDSGYQYFAQILKPTEGLPVVDGDEHKAMCAFILSMVCKGPHRGGQTVCNQSEVMTSCLLHLRNMDNMLLRQWACLCISQLWEDFPDAKWRGIREGALAALIVLRNDPYCEVRAAMLYAMTTFLGMPDLTDEVVRNEEAAAWSVLEMANDGSPMVRRELLVFLSHFVQRYENKFIVAAYEQLLEEKEYILFPPQDDGTEHKMGLHYARPENRNKDGSINPSAHGLSHNTLYAAIWKHLMVMTVDPHPEVQRDATSIVDLVHNAVLASPIGEQAQSLMVDVERRARRTVQKNQASSNRTSLVSPTTTDIASEPSLGLLKRTASFFFGQIMSQDRSSPPPSPGLGTKRASTGTKIVAPEDQNREASSQATYHTSKEPVSGRFEQRSMKQMPSLPLKSSFLQWSIEYFREPQMRPNESEEPGSTEYNERLWRRSRNENILRETQPQKQHAGSHKWDNQVALLDNRSQPTRIAFHQFENHMAAADNGNTVTIWDWQKPYSLNRFSNGNPDGSKISDIKFINEDDQAFLMTGSSDGVMRVYRNYESDKSIELATSWRALTHMVPSNVNSGMVFDWQQVTGRVLVAGDIRVIRVWAAAYETCIMDIPARSGSCVTSLTSDQMTGNLFVAGFGDGAVRVFDTRCRPQDSMVQKWKDDSDRQWIKSVHMQRGGQRELVSASRNGKVKLWDIRKDTPIGVIRTTKETLRTASVHEHLPVFAVGTSGHLVKVFNFSPGEELSRYEPYTRFLQQNRASPIATTAFHPHKMILGSAARGDNHINIIACEHDNTSDRFRP